MLERHVKEALKKYLKEIGAYYFMPVQTGYGAATVDFLVCHGASSMGSRPSALASTKSAAGKRLSWRTSEPLAVK